MQANRRTNGRVGGKPRVLRDIVKAFRRPPAVRLLPVGLTTAFGLGQIVGPIVSGYGFDLTRSFLASSLVAAVGLCISAALTVVVGRS